MSIEEQVLSEKGGGCDRMKCRGSREMSYAARDRRL